jgi:hypothetical protein
MRPSPRHLLGSLALVLALCLPQQSCATIAGTAVSPITGGVDLCLVSLKSHQWYFVPPVFLAGAIAGPFVAFFNGVNYDPTVFKSFNGYWYGFDQVFRPFRMIGL